MVPGDGGAAMWPLLTNVLRVREFLFTGDPISAELAVELGLATRVVPRAELMDEAMRLARRLAKQPRYALQDTKKTINLHLARALTGAIQTGVATERVGLASADHRERLERLITRSVVQRPTDNG
jgi:enoyl-CoA hydratase